MVGKQRLASDLLPYAIGFSLLLATKFSASYLPAGEDSARNVTTMAYAVAGCDPTKVVGPQACGVYAKPASRPGNTRRRGLIGPLLVGAWWSEAHVQSARGHAGEAQLGVKDRTLIAAYYDGQIYVGARVGRRQAGAGILDREAEIGDFRVEYASVGPAICW